MPGNRPIPDERGVFCNRTLNMRTIRAIGYDMDYTLIHYKVDEWEGRAYAYIKEKLRAIGWPVDELEFDANQVIRSLILDTELGNILKVDRFGYVKRASHGTRPIEFKEQRLTYARTLIDLHDDRYEFLNTLFSLSEAWMFGQLVDLLDRERLPAGLSYRDIYRTVRASTDETHMEGRLKADIIADPDRFVDLDPDTPLALLDQRRAGKKILLITNSEWAYSSAMMSYAFDRYLPDDMTWRDLFDVIIVAARKPTFFSTDICGKSAYDWNIRFTGRLWAGMLMRSSPARVTDPWSGHSNPARIRSSVVLPQPDGPSNAKNSFSMMSSDTLLRASTEPKLRLTSLIESSVIRRLLQVSSSAGQAGSP